MIKVFKNGVAVVDITPYLNSRGWTVDANNRAVHTAGITGDMEFSQYSLIMGSSYEYSITIDDLTSGDLTILASGVVLDTITSDGYYQGQFIASSNGYMVIRSGGDVKVSSIQVKLDKDENESLPNNTITWSEDRKKWVTFKDFIPEHGFSMFTNLFTVKDGYLYMHTDEVPFNTFYGKYYESKIQFPVYSNGVKTYQSMAVHSNRPMETTEDGITTQLNHVSDLVIEDFKTKDGIHYANFLRDKVTGIVDGDRLKGRYIIIELLDKENTKLQLFKTNIKSSAVTPNE